MTVYSINDLEKITGIKAHTIRIWEKRYEVVHPKRTATNIRYYEDQDLKKLLNISTLNRHGIKISQVIGMSPREVSEKIMEISGHATDYESQINSLILAMMELHEEQFDKVLSSATLKLGFEKTVLHILYPFLEKIGILWQVGTINPAQEHFVSALIRQKLIIAIDGQGYASRPGHKTFVLFLPENEWHELGLLFYNYLIRKNGHKVIYLGQSVPVNDLREVVRLCGADFLLTYFISALPPKELPDYLDHLSSTFAQQTILVTGTQIQNLDQELPDNISRIKNAINFKEALSDIS
ncbi:MAG: MerR family transcriptional regulator [Bacteroidales bacterium]